MLQWKVPFLCAMGMFLYSCAQVTAPDARNVNIPSPIAADERRDAVNERPDSVMYLPLGEDVLVPEKISGGKLPGDLVGPFELRSETLAAALQLVLAEYDISIAFETDAGLSRKVTVANLKGPLYQVVNRVCSLADLYCSYEEGGIVVKDTQTFAVTLPPLAGSDGGSEFISDTIQGLTAVIGDSGTAPVSDPTSRTLIYSATQRTAKLAENYFQRLRANTAMIVFETYIWEVSLGSGNSTGIDWESFDSFGKFNTSIGVNGSVAADFTNPISIGLPTTSAIGANPTQLVEFLSQFGAVKTISQPQITVLSGSEAQLRVADTENYVSEVTSTISGDQTTTSVSTASVDSGFTLDIDSSWDRSTVYANVSINLTNVDEIEDFTFSDSGDNGTDTIIQLPQTSERELITQIRVRPGDSVLIGGLVRETDNFNSSGPGFMEPVIPSSRTATTQNLELVILMRPRVIVYTDTDNKKYKKYVEDKSIELRTSKAREEWMKKNVPPQVQAVDLPKKEVKSVSTAVDKNDIIKDNVVELKSASTSVEPISLVKEVESESVAVIPVIEKKPEIEMVRVKTSSLVVEDELPVNPTVERVQEVSSENIVQPVSSALNVSRSIGPVSFTERPNEALSTSQNIVSTKLGNLEVLPKEKETIQENEVSDSVNMVIDKLQESAVEEVNANSIVSDDINLMGSSLFSN